MNDEFFPPGYVAPDDPAVQRAMEVIDGLHPSEQRELIRSSYRAALAYRRTGDIDHLERFADNFLETVHLRGMPAYAEALKRPPRGPRGREGTLDVEEVLNRLAE
ncbi:hypothetical protein GCM10010140_11790 [Streptosporangium pseudovulgare]|uniref:Uncharacterized protein n=1 Tax=Streptosporangium pseudovulgare TaxID=35765 RepID=A0ABQ2QLA1_9ACTN|nr:hypothetical protein GCM10010140_11790 [Streptosporangium pseudovulgare]